VILDVSKLDSGSWMLAGTNTHSGTTSINAGRLILGNPSALGNGGSQFGTTRGGTNVASGSPLDLNGQQDINEQITINGSGISAAGALVNNIATSASIAGGVISSISTNTGGVHSVVPNITVTGGGGAGATLIGTLGLSAASFNIVGGTTSHSVAPNVTITGGGGTGATATAVLTGGVVSSITITYAGTGYTSSPTLLFSGGTVIIAGTNPTGIGNSNNFVVSAITVNNPGSGYTSVPSVSFGSGSGTVATANLSTVILSGNSSIGGTGDVTINAPVSGSFALTKVGIGSLTLAAPSTYSGPTTVSAGKLVLAGNLIGPIVNHATLAPRGNPSTTGAITLGAAGVYQARLNNTIPGSGYDQLSGNGAVSLNGLLNILVGPDLAPGSSFSIINKTSPGATTGSFIGMPENSSFSAGGYMFRVNYNTGTGQNDVWLTLITSPIQQWRFTNFGSMLNAGRGENQSDNDGDGVPNLIEYAMNMNPALGDSVPQLVTKTTSTFDFVYSKNTFAADVAFTVQWSDTLLDDWSSTGVGPPEILSEGAPTQQIKVAIPMSGDAAGRFVRLKLTSF
jgi:autotransporter-associated beta strand protein